MSDHSDYGHGCSQRDTPQVDTGQPVMPVTIMEALCCIAHCSGGSSHVLEAEDNLWTLLRS